MTASGLIIGAHYASVALFAFLALAAMGRRTTTGAVPFAYLMCAVAVYIGAQAMGLGSGGLEEGLLFVKVGFLGIAAIPVLWYLFVRSFTGRRRLTRIARLLLFAVPAATTAIVWGGGLRGLVYASAVSSTRGGLSLVSFRPGPWYWIFVAYTAALMMGILLMLAGSLGRIAPGHRAKTLLVLVGSLIPLAASIASILGFKPHGLDLDPLALDASGICFGVAVLRHDLLEVAFVGRERVIEALDDCIVVLDPEGRIADANLAARIVLGLGVGFAGTLLSQSGVGSALSPLAKGEADKVEFLAGTGDRVRKYSARASLVDGPRGERLGTALIIADVTESAALLARLTELAVTDELTGLSNRRCFFERARQEFGVAKRAGRPLSIVILDLDHFKLVNDEFGHAVGDEVLRCAASRMLGQLRCGDLLCRYGGEEFALLMQETDGEGATAAAERLRGAVGEGPIEFEGGSILVTASGGIYGAVPDDCEDLEDFIRRADAALYDAKAGGRDRICPWGAALERRLPC